MEPVLIGEPTISVSALPSMVEKIVPSNFMDVMKTFVRTVEHADHIWKMKHNTNLTVPVRMVSMVTCVIR